MCTHLQQQQHQQFTFGTISVRDREIIKTRIQLNQQQQQRGIPVRTSQITFVLTSMLLSNTYAHIFTHIHTLTQTLIQQVEVNNGGPQMQFATAIWVIFRYGKRVKPCTCVLNLDEQHFILLLRCTSLLFGVCV